MLDELTNDELRQLAKETIDRLTDQECAELLEWAKKEFPDVHAT